MKASSALLKHLKSAEKEAAEKAPKKNLLAATDDSDDEGGDNGTPIWLLLTTKKHIIDTTRLKPNKVSVPHPLNTDPSTTICLITANPQRTYKDLIASPAFPSELSARITRVIDVTKLKNKYKQYEAQRQLSAEHDLFVADDRIITQLPKILGKTFYKSSSKRPIPVDMQAPKARVDGKSVARSKDNKSTIEPKKLAQNIEKTIASALVSLSPSTLTSIKVGYAGWSAQKVAENIKAVSDEVIEKYVPQKWRNIKAIHIKGPNSAALPIWLADELWSDEKQVIDDDTAEQLRLEEEERRQNGRGKKRKAVGGVSDQKLLEGPEKQDKKAKLIESNDTNLDGEIAARKEKLKKQKEAASKAVEDDAVPAPVKEKKLKKVKSKSSIAA